MSKLRLTLACWNYDRTSALVDERVRPDGIDLNCLNMPVEETFFRMLRHREFDLAEMSLSSYTMSLFQPAPPFVAIPVFPSRAFRHSCISTYAGDISALLVRSGPRKAVARTGSPVCARDTGVVQNLTKGGWAYPTSTYTRPPSTAAR